MRPAFRTNQAVARGGTAAVAKLADFRIDQPQTGFEPVLGLARRGNHAGNLFFLAAAERQFQKNFHSPPVPACVRSE
jgi:hypothetical protein